MLVDDMEGFVELVSVAAAVDVLDTVVEPLVVTDVEAVLEEDTEPVEVTDVVELRDGAADRVVVGVAAGVRLDMIDGVVVLEDMVEAVTLTVPVADTEAVVDAERRAVYDPDPVGPAVGDPLGLAEALREAGMLADPDEVAVVLRLAPPVRDGLTEVVEEREAVVLCVSEPLAVAVLDLAAVSVPLSEGLGVADKALEMEAVFVAACVAAGAAEAEADLEEPNERLAEAVAVAERLRAPV